MVSITHYFYQPYSCCTYKNHFEYCWELAEISYWSLEIIGLPRPINHDYYTKKLQAAYGHWFQLKQQKEERTKLLESLSKEKETVGQIEKQREEIMKEKDELEKKCAEAEEALQEVPYMLRLHRGISSKDFRVFIRHQRSENSLFTMQNSPANV